MNQSFWLAFAAYVIPTFPLGYFWHLVTFREQYERLALYREQVIIPFGLASMLLQAVIFAWIYPRVFNTDRAAWLSSAGAFALVFGLLAFSFTTLPVAAKYRMTSIGSFMALESAFTAVQFLIVAPLIALAWRNPA
jgi:riboflavin transporter FmnP